MYTLMCGPTRVQQPLATFVRYTNETRNLQLLMLVRASILCLGVHVCMYVWLGCTNPVYASYVTQASMPKTDLAQHKSHNCLPCCYPDRRQKHIKMGYALLSDACPLPLSKRTMPCCLCKAQNILKVVPSTPNVGYVWQPSTLHNLLFTSTIPGAL